MATKKHGAGNESPIPKVDLGSRLLSQFLNLELKGLLESISHERLVRPRRSTKHAEVMTKFFGIATAHVMHAQDRLAIGEFEIAWAHFLIAVKQLGVASFHADPEKLMQDGHRRAQSRVGSRKKKESHDALTPSDQDTKMRVLLGRMDRAEAVKEFAGLGYSLKHARTVARRNGSAGNNGRPKKRTAG